MQSDGWPQIVSERFQGESPEAHRMRSRLIADIITGFRMGRFAPEIAERKERELIRLQEFGLERLSA